MHNGKFKRNKLAEFLFLALLEFIDLESTQGVCLSADAQVLAVEHNIGRSVFILCSAAHDILENQLTGIYFALLET